MNGFQKRREKKMEDIIESALELFSEKGIKEVSIVEIAKKANVSQVSIYNYFENKENLAKQVLFKIMDRAMEHLEILVNDDSSFKEKFEKMIFVSFDTANNIDENLYQSEFLKDPIVQNFLEEYKQNKAVPLLMSLINQGKKEGHINSEINSEISSESVLLYINSLNSVLQSDISKKVRMDLGKLFFYGLFGEKK